MEIRLSVHFLYCVSQSFEILGKSHESIQLPVLNFLVFSDNPLFICDPVMYNSHTIISDASYLNNR